MAPGTVLKRLPGWAWAAPNSLLGLACGALVLVLGGRVQRVGGALEFWGGLAARVVAAVPGARDFGALTLGHVILGTGAAELVALRAHEQVHVRQYERWGPFFLPAYALSSVWQRLQGRCPYRDNVFERQARALAARPGQEWPLRPRPGPVLPAGDPPHA